MMTDLVDAVDPQDAGIGRTKDCPRCHKRFGCAHGEPGCWCESIILRRETLIELRTIANVCEARSHRAFGGHG